MADPKHYPPGYCKAQFHCPHCNVFAKQFWAHMRTQINFDWVSPINKQSKFDQTLGADWAVSRCQHCGKNILWFQEQIVHPKAIPVGLPNEDMDQEIIDDYMEAARVFSDSPRSTAALLRLALQKLCKQLGQSGDNINADIKKLVEAGLNPLVQKSLDALRITGNNAVHPGEINLNEEPERVLKLFDLLNFIANKMITEPKAIAGFYDGLPDGARIAVEKRDKKEN